MERKRKIITKAKMFMYHSVSTLYNGKLYQKIDKKHTKSLIQYQGEWRISFGLFSVFIPNGLSILSLDKKKLIPLHNPHGKITFKYHSKKNIG